MPTYVYKFVKTGETVEVQQSFSDSTLTTHKHPETGRMMAVKKVFQPVGVTFKGSGFFKNDNRDKKSTTIPSTSSDSSGSSDSDSGSSASSDKSSSDTSSSTSTAKTETKKTDTKTTTKSDAKSNGSSSSKSD